MYTASKLTRYTFAWNGVRLDYCLHTVLGIRSS